MTRSDRRLVTGNRSGLESRLEFRRSGPEAASRVASLSRSWSDGPRRLSCRPLAPVYLDHNLSYSPCSQWRHFFLVKLSRANLSARRLSFLFLRYSTSISQSVVAKCTRPDKPLPRSHRQLTPDTEIDLELDSSFLRIDPIYYRSSGFMRRNDNPRPSSKGYSLSYSSRSNPNTKFNRGSFPRRLTTTTTTRTTRTRTRNDKDRFRCIPLSSNPLARRGASISRPFAFDQRRAAVVGFYTRVDGNRDRTRM